MLFIPKKIKLIKGILVLLFLFSTFNLEAQSGKINAQSLSGYGTQVHFGYVMVHTNKMYNLRSHVGGTEFYWFKKTSGINAWEKQLGNPVYGISAYYLNFGKINILGNAYGILPWIEFPIFKNNTSNFSLKLTSGIGFITKPFNLEKNAFNNSIGSHLNANMGIHFTYEKRITNNLNFKSTLGINHFSNGNIKRPNLGVNSMLIAFGINYNVKKTKLKPDEHPSNETQKWYNQTGFLFAVKQTDYIFKHTVFVPIIQSKFLYNINQKNWLTFGIDLQVDKGNYYNEFLQEKKAKTSLNQTFETGLKIGHDLRISRFSVVTEVGYYVISPNNIKGNLFQRIGFQYLCRNNLVLNYTLKTHFGNADYFEFGMFYKFSLKK